MNHLLRIPATHLALVCLLWTALEPGAGHAITTANPAYTIPRMFPVSPALPRPLGGFRFSTDGNTLYVVGEADTSASALYSMPVTRHPTTHEVTALGAPTLVFNGVSPPDMNEPINGMDAGLEFGPSGTFFYTYFPTKFLAQRPGGFGGTQSLLEVPQLPSVSGLVFSPFRIDSGTNFGQLQVSTGFTDDIYEVPLVTTGTPGLFALPALGTPTLFATAYWNGGGMDVGGPGVGGMQYVPTGPLAGDLVYASFFGNQVWRILINDATGLPIGSAANPTEAILVDELPAPALGLEVDPITNNDLLVGTWDDTVDANNVIYQVQGIASTTTTIPSGTTTSTTSTTTTATISTTTATTTTSTTTTTTSTTTTHPSTTTTSPTTTTTFTTSTTMTTSTTTTSTSTTAATTTTTTSTTTTQPSTTTTSTNSTSTSTTAPTTTTMPGSTTTTVPSSSTTTTSATSTTTTLAPICSPADPRTCDDSNPCTDDICVGGTACQHDARTGLDALTCTCDIPLGNSCSGQTLPASIPRLSEKSCSAFAGVSTSAFKGKRRRLLQGAKALKKAIARVNKATKSGALSADCSSALLERFGGARDGARQLATTF